MFTLYPYPYELMLLHRASLETLICRVPVNSGPQYRPQYSNPSFRGPQNMDHMNFGTPIRYPETLGPGLKL